MRAHRLRLLRAIVAASMIVVATGSGCSTGSSAASRVSGWFGGDSTPQTAWVRAEGAAVLAEPSQGARQVGRLASSENVVRTKKKNGYVHVSARGGRLEGWVEASKLTTTRATAKPTAPSPPVAEEADAAEAGPDADGPDAAGTDEATTTVGDALEAAEAAAEAAPPPAPAPAAPSGGATKGVGASVFDPY